jgi:hypothetical protein
LLSVIVQATILPALAIVSGAESDPTLAWKPVVRLTARQGLLGQLGAVGEVVLAFRPTSSNVAFATVGSAKAPANAATVPAAARRILILELTIVRRNT